jgi:hypothetical protein
VDDRSPEVSLIMAMRFVAKEADAICPARLALGATRNDFA